MNRNSKIYIAGHSGMLGSAIHKELLAQGYSNIITISSSDLNLLNQGAVESFFDLQVPEYVFLCAAKVGGIQANINNPGSFLFDNLQIQNNVINSSLKYGVKKLLFLGSSCIYPKNCPQPMIEDYLLTGKLEPTNEGYAIAKIAGLKLVEGFNKQFNFNGISIMPCNLYGPNDSFDLEHSHVLSALVKRFVDAVDNNVGQIELWGSGEARREFMHVDDAARACVFMMNNYDKSEFINIGTGVDISIVELAHIISKYTGFEGEIKWDISKPDGMMKKCMDVSKMLELGFCPSIKLEIGIQQMIEIYKNLKN